MRRFGVGVIGAGDIVRQMHLPVLLNVPSVQVTWIYDHDEGRCVNLARAYGVRAVAAATPSDLPECDVALLAIPMAARSSYLDEFAGRGSAVLCEKPFALAVADHEHFVSQYPAHRLGCGYMRR